MSDEYYERNASNVATDIIIKAGTPGAILGGIVGGPIGAALGFFATTILFGAPKALEADRQHHERERGRR